MQICFAGVATEVYICHGSGEEYSCDLISEESPKEKALEESKSEEFSFDVDLDF